MKSTYYVNIEALTKPSKFKKGIWGIQVLMWKCFGLLKKGGTYK